MIAALILKNPYIFSKESFLKWKLSHVLGSKNPSKKSLYFRTEPLKSFICLRKSNFSTQDQKNSFVSGNGIFSAKKFSENGPKRLNRIP